MQFKRFGQPTFEMRELLRKFGLELKNVNNQYEDHMGIELLFLSVLCSRVAQGNVPDGESVVEPAESSDVVPEGEPGIVPDAEPEAAPNTVPDAVPTEPSDAVPVAAPAEPSDTAPNTAPDATPAEPSDILEFIEAHPLTWIASFHAAVAAAAPGSYYDCLLGVAHALLNAIHSELIA